MKRGAMRSVTLGLAIAIAMIASAGAQVTYQVGVPPPGALPPIDTPPATDPPSPAPVVPAPVSPDILPPDSAGTTPADGPTAPRPAMVPSAPPVPGGGRPDVNNPVKQTGEVVKDLAKGDVKALREGPLLIHGNYCGIGNRPGTAPTDALDEACMHHDACTTEGKLPNCDCDNHLKSDAMRIAQDPRTPPKIQVLAATMAASMAILICK